MTTNKTAAFAQTGLPRNVEMMVDEVDGVQYFHIRGRMDSDLGPTSSGKSTLVASTAGHKLLIVDGESTGLTINLTATRRK